MNSFENQQTNRLYYFYARLREYNKSHFPADNSWPEWCSIYQSTNPPIYWIRLAAITCKFPINYSCLEIGSGMGDILALLLFLGFKDVKGLEREEKLASAANKKIHDLFGIDNCVMAEEYPVNIEPCPDLLIQMNCVYYENIQSKKEYLNRIRSWHTWNGVPSAYIIEVLDSSFKKEHRSFPQFLRVSENEIRTSFKGYEIESYPSYTYPEYSSTKRIYCINSKRNRENSKCLQLI